MRIALIGYGRMGKEIESAALSRGHTIALIVDKDNIGDLNPVNLKEVDVAVEFTSPDEAFNNCKICLEAGVPVISGTTGWTDRLGEIKSICEKLEVGFIHSSNFSIGVNILFYLNRELAKKMESYAEYHVDISEIHHTGKLDAPSGTAITLANDIIANNFHYDKWRKSDTDDMQGGEDNSDSSIPVGSERTGDVAGTHEISWRSPIDNIFLKHQAHGRQGFVTGALYAAEYIIGKRGFLTMRDMLGF